MGWPQSLNPYGVLSVARFSATNPNNLSLADFERLIKARLIDGEWFCAKEWGVPDLHFDHWTDDDHGWHEFVSLEFVE